jgi:hypothetical protein
MKIIKVLEMKLIERTLLLDLVKRGRMKRTVFLHIGTCIIRMSKAVGISRGGTKS